MPTPHVITARVLHSPVDESARFLPEGPRAVTVFGQPALAWVNIQSASAATSGSIFVRSWGGSLREFPQPRRPGFLFPTDRPDTLLVGMEKEVGLLDLSTNTFAALADIGDANPRTIINDGEIVPGGEAIVFGTKDIQFADTIANLYLFTPGERSLSLLEPNQTCSNGKVIKRDNAGLFLYDIDTPRKNVRRYHLDVVSRRVADEVEILDLREESGFPDGMVDVGDGTVVIAFYNPGDVWAGRAVRYALANGAAVAEWRTPGSPRVTCPQLIEHAGQVRLVLTTATEGMPAEMRGNCPNAGDLFWAETDIARLQPGEFVRIGQL